MFVIFYYFPVFTCIEVGSFDHSSSNHCLWSFPCYHLLWWFLLWSFHFDHSDIAHSSFVHSCIEFYSFPLIIRLWWFLLWSFVLRSFPFDHSYLAHSSFDHSSILHWIWIIPFDHSPSIIFPSIIHAFLLRRVTCLHLFNCVLQRIK